MRRMMLGLAVVAVGSWMASDCHAQLNGNNLGLVPTDPIQFYYGFYLPRQAAQAMQPGPEATINAVTADRQSYAATNRGTLFDPISPFSLESDPFGGTGPNGAGRRGSATVRSRSGTPTTHVLGSGPTGYYNRAVNYYPSIRVSRGANKNVAVTKASRGVQGMPNMGGGGMGGGFGGGFGPR